ncbi:class I SAM-dependent methyltransferase [Streptomyces sp. NPDC090301]|uniref:class I SAM-dependent methyltransferase n=1 Tax=Streptomyces sp. NPDC090301 TaxID=3154975 RepID=UPI00344A2435
MTLLRDDALAAAFDRAAPSYDRMTAANPGYHGHLRRSARRLCLPDEGSGLSVLDLGCGTGSSTRALLHAAPRATLTGVDASAGMLERARAKTWPSSVTFVHAAAEDVGSTDAAGPHDAVFAAYLFRNLADPDVVLRTVRDLLRPGGRIAVHEYALSGRAVHRTVWNAVMRGLVVPWGRLHGDAPLYEHLHRSVLAFDTAEQFADRLHCAGFVDVQVLPLPGWQTGVTHTFLAKRG